MKRQNGTVTQKLFSRLSVVLSSWWARVAFVLVLLAVPLAIFLVNKQQASALPCPCNMFTTPTGQSDFNDGGTLELGFKFRADVSGYITAIRFYKQGPMSGTHVGTLWDLAGNPLSTITFTGETASGWQEMALSAPYAVTAGTTYVASVSMPDGRYIATTNYFSIERTNFPLRAPSSASSGGNGVFAGSAGTFPISSSNAANYWIDVAYRANLGSTPPVVTARTPAANAVDVNPGELISTTFDEAMDPTSITTSTFTVEDSNNNPVAGVVSYDSSTRVASFISDEGLDTSEVYTATVEGGGGTAVTNMEGVAMATDEMWSFTVSDTNLCPCSLMNKSNAAGAGNFDDSGSIELGTKIKSTANGYIHAVRFYKSILSTDTTHDVHVWSSTGSLLATATSSNEAEYGWHEVKLNTPLRMYSGQVYIVSYSSATSVYVATAGGLNSDVTSGYLTAYANESAQNAATGSANRNGVFSASAGTYPSSGSSNGSYYWVDAVFSLSTVYEDPLAVEQSTPAADAYGVDRTKPVRAKFNRGLDGSTVSNSSVRLFDASNNQVGGTASYEATSHTAVFTPSTPLTYNQQYTVRLSDSIEDAQGEALGAEHTWSFTVGKQSLTDVNQGPGGPVLVITTTANKYGTYYAEILRTEGLNYFEVKDMATVDAATLDAYDAVVLAETTLTQPQADMFSDWVTNDGGNLIAMRPDKKLAGLMGLTDASSTRTNQYMKVDTSSTPGQGIVSDSMQYKGIADNYTYSGATEVAQLYSDASTATGNPAVSKRAVGSNGGTAVAFTYDLAKSVIAQHQGNQAWVNDDRDGDGAKRSSDMFYGAKSGNVQPDWVDLNKIHIPQADEQQRLLANVITEATKDRKPLPRFWYLPNGQKAAMVMAGDDHGANNSNGPEAVLGKFINESPTNCDLTLWECVRASDYNYATSAFTAARARQYHALGFDLGDHPPDDGGGCNNFTSYAQLSLLTTNAYTTWRAKYTGIPNQRTTRYHCYIWSDWDSVARVNYDNGVRYDLDYVTFPSSWIGTRPAIITGSGMNMRLTDADGDIIDVHQGVTNFENTVTGSSAINTVLANATGSAGYYGMFGTHYDMSDSYHNTLFSAARANNVPIISSDQALTWLDGRNSSEFTDISGSDGQFTFGIEAGMGAQGLKSMMPIEDASGTLATLKRGATTVTYQTQAVKGVQYAVFDAVPGSYTATYTDYDPNPSTGGGSGGSGSESSGSDSSTPGSAQKKATTRKPGIAAVPTEEQTALPIGETPAPEPDDAKTEDDGTNPQKETDKAEEGSLWWLWLLGIGLFLALMWYIIFLIRRKHSNNQPTW